MSARIPHLLRQLVVLPLLAMSLAAASAQLDFTADAAVGKPNLTTGPGGTATASNLLGPSQVAEDPVSGELWVADYVASRVLRFSSAAAFANGEAAGLVLGQASFTDASCNRGGAPAVNTLCSPVGLAVDQAGRLYVTDNSNNRLLVYRPPFTNGMDATWVIGQADFTGASANRGGTPAANTLSGPRGIVVDWHGSVFVADSGNNRVLAYPAPLVTGVVAYRVFGQAGFTTSALATTASGMHFPEGLAIDKDDNLWVAEELNHRVVRFDDGAAGGDTTADLVLCQADFTTSGTGATASTCSGPAGVAVDREGVVYVVEYHNDRVLRYTTLANGAAATAVIGQASFTSVTCNRGLAAPTAETLCGPWSVMVDRNGNLLVGEYGNDRVVRYDLPRVRVAPAIASLSPESMPHGGTAFTLTVNGAGFYGNSVVNWNGSPRATQYLSDRRLLAQVAAADIAGAGPHAVTVANPAPGGGASLQKSFPLYARATGDNAADRVLGQASLTQGSNNSAQVGEEQVGWVNAATIASGGVRHLAIDRRTGRLFAVDYSSSRVMSWPAVSAFHNAQPADVILGQPDEFSSTCNTGGVSAASLCEPYGVAVVPSGALYVADHSNHRVLRYSPPFTTGMAATMVYGQGGSFTSRAPNNGGIGANSLATPMGVAASDTALFVYDTGNSRILVYNDPGADVTADVAIGQASLTTVDSPIVSSTRLGGGADNGLVLDADGGLFVASISTNRILRFSPPFANNMAADLVIGQPDFMSSAPATTATGLFYPTGMAVDPGGNLLVADFWSSRVLQYEAPLSSGMAATGVLGQLNFTSATTGCSATMFFRPLGLVLDRVGNLLLSDWGCARVLAFDRPFAFLLYPDADLDGDGMPNSVEFTEGRDPYLMDNDVFANARLFVMQQYRDFLNREGDEPGIVGWTNIIGGGYTRPQVIDAFLSSDEFAGFVSPVVRLYFATFLRVPDFDGLTFNAGLVRNGTVTLTQLADFFTASPEFAATYGALDNTAFVTLLYANVLGRAPDPAGLAGWVSLLTGGYTRGQVLLGFSDSVEYQAAMANEVFVTMMYAGMLRRTPEPAGFNGWVGFLDAATYSREQVINGFFLSTEYHGRFLP